MSPEDVFGFTVVSMLGLSILMPISVLAICKVKRAARRWKEKIDLKRMRSQQESHWKEVLTEASQAATSGRMLIASSPEVIKLADVEGKRMSINIGAHHFRYVDMRAVEGRPQDDFFSKDRPKVAKWCQLTSALESFELREEVFPALNNTLITRKKAVITHDQSEHVFYDHQIPRDVLKLFDAVEQYGRKWESVHRERGTASGIAKLHSFSSGNLETAFNILKPPPETTLPVVEDEESVTTRHAKPTLKAHKR